jgi:hypothetical protein
MTKTTSQLEKAILGLIEEYERRADKLTDNIILGGEDEQTMLFENTKTVTERNTLLQIAVDLEQLIWRHD